MRDNIYYTTKERSKVFIQLGKLVGIKATRKTQRGIIAKKALQVLHNYELEQFSKQLVKFELQPTLKINEGGKTWYI